MIVVADASPINYLVQIEAGHILPKLFGRVIFPKEVREELKHPAAPAAVREWIEAGETWIEFREPQNEPDEKIRLLDPGERSAILLAVELGVDLLLIDERRGRAAATERGLKTLGTLGVLLQAEKQGLLDALRAFDQLVTTTNFHAAPDLREYFVQQRKRYLELKP